MEEVKAASLELLDEPDLEDETPFFTEEEDEPSEPEPLDEFAETPRPPIELKTLPPGLTYAFLNNNPEFPVIISDKLTQDQTLRLMTILEKHHSVFGYSLQDLTGISPMICTHCIPTDPSVTPSREPQRRLNNTMREIRTLFARDIPPTYWIKKNIVPPRLSTQKRIEGEDYISEAPLAPGRHEEIIIETEGCPRRKTSSLINISF